METNQELSENTISSRLTHLCPPSISVTYDTSAPLTDYVQHGLPGGRPISEYSIDSVASFICSEASSWISNEYDDAGHLLSAVHRLSMSSVSSWTVSDLGDDFDLGEENEFGRSFSANEPKKDSLIRESLKTLATMRDEGNETSTSCRTTVGSEFVEGSIEGFDSVITTSDASPEASAEHDYDTSGCLRQSLLLDDFDVDFQMSLDISIDDARVATAHLIQQDSTLVAMSEARILQLPLVTSSATSSTRSLGVISNSYGGLSESMTLNRLGKIPDVAAVTTQLAESPIPPKHNAPHHTNRRQVAHLNFWERLASNSAHGKATKRRSHFF